MPWQLFAARAWHGFAVSKALCSGQSGFQDACRELGAALMQPYDAISYLLSVIAFHFLNEERNAVDCFGRHLACIDRAGRVCRLPDF